MKSSIKIALGQDNKPVIEMRVHSTDDVRDILFRQFKEGFYNGSTLCSAYIDSGYASGDPEGLNATITISPLSSNSDYICYLRVEEIYNTVTNNGKMYDLVMITGGGIIGFYKDAGKGQGKEFSREELRSLNIVDLVELITKTITELTAEHSLV